MGKEPRPWRVCVCAKTPVGEAYAALHGRAQLQVCREGWGGGGCHLIVSDRVCMRARRCMTHPSTEGLDGRRLRCIFHEELLDLLLERRQPARLPLLLQAEALEPVAWFERCRRGQCGGSMQQLAQLLAQRLRWLIAMPATGAGAGTAKLRPLLVLGLLHHRRCRSPPRALEAGRAAALLSCRRRRLPPRSLLRERDIQFACRILYSFWAKWACGN